MSRGLKIFVQAALIIRFIFYYLGQMIISNLILARDILSPDPKFQTGIVKIELDMKGDNEILALVNLISMTPGSLTVDVSEDRKYIFVHAMYLRDIEAFKKSIKDGLEKKIMEITK